jgi:4'-phosphopantetheinyl transferase
VTTVHLLLHDLDADQTSEAELDSLLDGAERGRAERFVQPLHRRRFKVGRAMLRRTLASSTGVPAANIEFKYGRNGKPELIGGPAFNVSHSEGTLLIGVAECGRLGVDVEVLRPISDRLTLAAANFARAEVAALESVPAGEQDEAFLRIWTCKEAFIKAIGDGLALRLDSFAVAPTRASNALDSLDAESLGAAAEGDWHIRRLTLDQQRTAAVGAVAVDTGNCEVSWLPAAR